MSGAWSQLEQLLTCAICLDRFRNPKLLPCQHTFCGEPCMEGLVDYARRQIKCPECRAEHRIPYNGVQSFPNNVTLARFLDLHRSITGEEPEPLPSQMDRCSVCGEKSYCNRCAHCEKKVCDECRAAHLDILRREINRINSQIRRGLDKLSEHAQQADKGSEKLLMITSQIRDEITESVRRMVKDLKDKENKLLEELDEFTVSETKNTRKLKEDFETELTTIISNCELAEEHITDADEWTDIELMEYKEIFLKTLDFLRNLDPDSMDYSRKIKYIQKVDLDNLRRTAADFGEIKILQPVSNFNSPLSPSESSNNLSVPQSSLMRSQSDHRLAQFGTSRTQRTDPLQRSYLDVTGQNRYGSDSERERGSSPPGRRGEVRYGSVHERTSSRFTRADNDFAYTRSWPRPGDSDYEPSNSANFRSRFMRERIRERTGNADVDHSFEEHDSDVSPAHRVRFQEESPSRPKLFDTEEMANMRTPLSGLVKLIDSPHVMERLHQNEIKAKQKEAENKENEINNQQQQNVVTTNSAPLSTPIHRPSRQISEDEIEKQKKQNQAAFSQQQSPQANNTASNNNTNTNTTNNNNNNNNTNTNNNNNNNNNTNNNNNNTSSQPATPKSTVVKHSSTNNTGETTTFVTNRRIQAIQKEEKRPPSSSDDNSESGDMNCDDDLMTTLTTPNSNTSSARRRIYASSHTSTSGTTTGNKSGNSGLTNNYSQSIDYGDTSSSSSIRNKYSQPTLSSTENNNRQVLTSSTSSLLNTMSTSKRTALVPGEDLMTGSVQPHSISPSKLLSSSDSNNMTTFNNNKNLSSSSSSGTYNNNNLLSSSSSSSASPSSTTSFNKNIKLNNKKSNINYSGSGSGGGNGGSDIFDDFDQNSYSTASNYIGSTNKYNQTTDATTTTTTSTASASLFNVSSSTSPISIMPRYHQSSLTNGNATIHHASSLNALSSAYPISLNQLSSGTGMNTNWRDFQSNNTSISGTTSSSSPIGLMESSLANVPVAAAVSGAPNSSTDYSSSSSTSLPSHDSNKQSLSSAQAQANPDPSSSSLNHNGNDDDDSNNSIRSKHNTNDKNKNSQTDENNNDIISEIPNRKRIRIKKKDNIITKQTNIDSVQPINQIVSRNTSTNCNNNNLVPSTRNSSSTSSYSSSLSLAGLYSRHDFKGQDKPDYKPYRQSRNSLNIGNSFIGVPTLSNSIINSSNISSYRPSYSYLNRSRNDSLTTINNNHSSNLRSYRHDSNHSNNITSLTSPKPINNLHHYSSYFRSSGENTTTTATSTTISPSTATTTSTTGNYRHTLLSMGIPDSSNGSASFMLLLSSAIFVPCSRLSIGPIMMAFAMAINELVDSLITAPSLCNP